MKGCVKRHRKDGRKGEPRGGWDGAAWRAMMGFMIATIGFFSRLVFGQGDFERERERRLTAKERRERKRKSNRSRDLKKGTANKH